MVVDLKVLVRSFNCESRACYVGNPRESVLFFRVRKSNILFRESFAKVGYHDCLTKVLRKIHMEFAKVSRK